MSLLAWLRRLATPTTSKGRRPAGKRSRSPWDRALPRLEALEDRLAPASIVNVVVGVSGSQNADATFLAGNGTLRASDLPNQVVSLSTGALTSIGANGDISVTAQTAITFPDFASGGGSLALQPGLGHAVTFQTQGTTASSISFTNPSKNTIATGGANITFSAGADLIAAGLTINSSTAASTLSLTAGTRVAGNLTLGGSANAGAGAATVAAMGGAIFNGNTTFNNVTAATLSLTAATGIGSTATPLNTAVGAIAAQTTKGDIFVINTGNLTVGFDTEPAGVKGVQSLGGSGNVSLVSNGSVTINRNGDTVKGISSATVQAVGAASSLLTGGNNTGATGAVVATAGGVTLGAGANILLGDSTAHTRGDVQGTNGTVALTAGQAITLDEGTVLSALGTGNLSATGNNSIVLQHTSVAGARIVTQGGTLSLTTGTGGTFTLDSGAGGTVSNALGGLANPVTVAADFMNIKDPITATAGGVVVLTTASAPQVINLGGSTPGELLLSDSELDLVTAAVLRVGSMSNTGGIVLTGAITQAGSGYGTLSLITGGSITESGGSITGNKLALQAAGGIGTALLALDTVVSNLAFSNTAGVVNVSNATQPLAGQALTLSPVDTLTASTNTGTTTTVTSNGPLTVGTNLTGAGDVTLVTVKVSGAAASDITVNGGQTVQSAAGNIVVESADSVFLPAGAALSDLATSAGVVLPSTISVTAGFNNPGSTGVLNLAGSISVTPPAPNSASPNSSITLSAPGDVTLGSLTVGTLAAPTGTLTVTSTAGNIRDDGIDTTVAAVSTFNFSAAKAIGGDTQIGVNDVLTPDATLRAALDLQPGPNPSITANETGAGGNIQLRVTTGTFDTRLFTAVPTLKGSGNQLALIASGVLVNQVTTAGDLVVDSALTLPAAANVNLLLGATDGNNVRVTVGQVANNGATGDVFMVATAGLVQVNNSVTTGRNVRLVAGGNAAGNGVSVGATVSTNGGSILVDSNRDVSFTGTGQLVTSTGNGRQIIVTAAEDLPGSPTTGNGVFSMAAGTALDTSANNSTITVNVGGRAGQGGDATLATLNAGTGNVAVTAFTGNIVDGNGAGNNNITGGAISLIANGFNGIDTDVTTSLPATKGVSATDLKGPITLRSAVQMQVDTVNAGNNVATLTAGTLTSLHPNDGVADVTAGTVILTANTGTIGSFTTSAQFFEVATKALSAFTNGGTLWVSALGGAAVSTVDAGGGTAVLKTVNGDLTSTNSAPTPDVAGGTVSLLAVGAAGTPASLGSLTAPLLVSAGTLSALVTGGGSLNVSGVSGNLQVSQALTDGGPVNVGDVGSTLTIINPANAGNPVVGSAGGTVTLSANSITTTNTSGNPDVAAASFIAITKFQIGGATAPLQTQVNAFTAQGQNLFLNNTGPLLLAPIVGAPPFAVTGGITINATGALTVAEPIQAVRDVNLAATTGASANLTVNAGQSVSAGGKVNLSAGDSLFLKPGSVIVSRTQSAIALLLGTKGAGSNSTFSGVINGSTVTATGGAGNDFLTIDFTGGATLPTGLTFNGGSGGNDALFYSDLNGTLGHVYVLTTTNINRDGGNNPVFYQNIKALVVVGSLTNDLFIVQGTPKGAGTAIYGLGGANAVYVSSDAPVSMGDLSGLGGPLNIDPGTGPSNLLVVSEAGRVGADNVTLTGSTMTGTAGNGFSINYAPTGFFAGNVKLVVGGGNAVVHVQGTAAAAVTSLYTLGGNGTVIVSSPRGTLDTLLSTLDIDEGTGAAQLIVSEANALAGDNLVLSPNQIVSNSLGWTINYTASGGAFSRGVLVNTGGGNDVVTINGTTAGAYTSVNTGQGSDMITVNVSGPSGDPLVVDGGDLAALNTLFVNDVTGAASIFNVATGPGSGLVRVVYPGGAFRDVNYLEMQQVFTNPPSQ